MSAKIKDQLREACLKAQEAGIKIMRGPWFERGADNKVIGACAIGALLWANGKADDEHKVKEACILMEADAMWLRRFWMGFDRGYQAVIMDKDGRTVGQDDVSRMGIELAEELIK